jgi:hypothetical protein
MNLLRTALLCAAMIGLAVLSVVRAEDQSVSRNATATSEQPPVHCEGQNCLPPAEDHVEACKGQDCTPVPETDQAPAPEIEQVK